MKECIVCNIPLSEYNFQGDYCPACNSVFSSDCPSDIDLEIFYKSYNSTYHGGGRAKGATERQKIYADQYLKIVRKYSSGSFLIDIGSSNNPFPNIAQRNGYKVTVVDYIKPSALDDSILFISSSLEKLFLKNEYDIVTAFEVIEHTKDPLLAIDNLCKLCKKNGIIIIFIPEIGRFPDVYSLGTSAWFYPPEHLNLLSKTAIISIFNKNNCKLIISRRFELNHFRYLIRYGIGIIEGAVGFTIRLLFGSKVWFKIRKKRISRFAGISVFVFRKLEDLNIMAQGLL